MFECEFLFKMYTPDDSNHVFFSKRLLALATQKFVADIATDAFQYSKVRQSGNRKSGKVQNKKKICLIDVALT